MKEQKKKTKKRKASTRQKKPQTNNYDTDFADLGLEPPKIYRESQRRITEQQTKSGKNSDKNLTKAEKRQKETKKRKKKNKARTIFRWLFVILGVIVLGVVLSLTMFFNITTITASGSKIYSADKIISQCIIEKGDNLFLADTDAAEKRIEQNLPYVYKAEIKRKLPYTIEIKITDASAAYSVKCKDKTYILLDDNFKTLEKGAQMAQGIVISKASIKSAELGQTIVFKNEDVSTCLQRLAKAVKDNNFTEITAIYSNNISDNYVVYDNRITFKLGNSKDLETKIYKGLAACEKLDESNPNAEGTMTISTDKQIYFTEK